MSFGTMLPPSIEKYMQQQSINEKTTSYRETVVDNLNIEHIDDYYEGITNSELFKILYDEVKSEYERLTPDTIDDKAKFGNYTQIHRVDNRGINNLFDKDLTAFPHAVGNITPVANSQRVKYEAAAANPNTEENRITIEKYKNSIKNLRKNITNLQKIINFMHDNAKTKFEVKFSENSVKDKEFIGTRFDEYIKYLKNAYVYARLKNLILTKGFADNFANNAQRIDLTDADKNDDILGYIDGINDNLIKEIIENKNKYVDKSKKLLLDAAAFKNKINAELEAEYEKVKACVEYYNKYYTDIYKTPNDHPTGEENAVELLFNHAVEHKEQPNSQIVIEVFESEYIKDLKIDRTPIEGLLGKRFDEFGETKVDKHSYEQLTSDKVYNKKYLLFHVYYGINNKITPDNIKLRVVEKTVIDEIVSKNIGSNEIAFELRNNKPIPNTVAEVDKQYNGVTKTLQEAFGLDDETVNKIKLTHGDSTGLNNTNIHEYVIANEIFPDCVKVGDAVNINPLDRSKQVVYNHASDTHRNFISLSLSESYDTTNKRLKLVPEKTILIKDNSNTEQQIGELVNCEYLTSTNDWFYCEFIPKLVSVGNESKPVTYKSLGKEYNIRDNDIFFIFNSLLMKDRKLNENLIKPVEQITKIVKDGYIIPRYNPDVLVKQNNLSSIFSNFKTKGGLLFKNSPSVDMGRLCSLIKCDKVFVSTRPVNGKIDSCTLKSKCGLGLCVLDNEFCRLPISYIGAGELRYVIIKSKMDNKPFAYLKCSKQGDVYACDGKLYNLDDVVICDAEISFSK